MSQLKKEIESLKYIKTFGQIIENNSIVDEDTGIYTNRACLIMLLERNDYLKPGEWNVCLLGKNILYKDAAGHLQRDYGKRYRIYSFEIPPYTDILADASEERVVFADILIRTPERVVLTLV